jgi:hypothetical protein
MILDFTVVFSKSLLRVLRFLAITVPELQRPVPKYPGFIGPLVPELPPARFGFCSASRFICNVIWKCILNTFALAEPLCHVGQPQIVGDAEVRHLRAPKRQPPGRLEGGLSVRCRSRCQPTGTGAAGELDLVPEGSTARSVNGASATPFGVSEPGIQTSLLFRSTWPFIIGVSSLRSEVPFA